MGWTFFNYLSERGTDEIEEWEDSLPAQAAAKVAWVLTMLSGMSHLRRPYVGTRANYPLHYEIVVKCSGQQLRPLGCYGPADRGEFTLLLGAEEKGGALIPKAADSIADGRRKIIKADPKRARKRDA